MRMCGYLLVVLIMSFVHAPYVCAQGDGKSPTELLQEYERQFPTTMDFESFCTPDTVENDWLKKLSTEYAGSDDRNKIRLKEKLAKAILISKNHPVNWAMAKMPLCEGWTIGTEPSAERVRAFVSYGNEPESRFTVPIK